MINVLMCGSVLSVKGGMVAHPINQGENSLIL